MHGVYQRGCQQWWQCPLVSRLLFPCSTLVPSTQCPPCSAHHPVPATQCSTSSARHPVLTTQCSPSSAHHAVPTIQCPPPSARHPVLATQCSPSSAHHPVLAIQCPPPSARHPVPATCCPLIGMGPINYREAYSPGPSHARCAPSVFKVFKPSFPGLVRGL